MTDPAAAVIVLAGGRGARMGAGRNKVFLPLAGRPMLAWSLDTFVGVGGVSTVVLVARAPDRALAETVTAAEAGWRGVEVVTGGATRQDSELAGLRQLAGRIGDGSIDTVLIHDGARPLVGRALVAEVLRTARECGGAVPGVPRDDLVAVGPGGSGVAGPAPAGLVAVQTPQGFAAGPLLAAYEEAARHGFVGTDTAACVQPFAPEIPIRWVRGEERNFKITYAHDMAVAEAALARSAGPLTERSSGAAPRPPGRPDRGRRC